MFARRLDDRIRKLATAIPRGAPDSPETRAMLERLKGEVSEYFERERNPPNNVEKRSGRLRTEESH